MPGVGLEMRALALVGLAGCWANAQPAWTPPAESSPATAPPLQCPIRLTPAGHVMVWESDLGAITPDGVVATRDLTIHSLGDQALVALRDVIEPHPRGGDTLWRVSCAGKQLETITIPGADFGHSALDPDRRRLFYTAGSVVAVLDLATRTSTPVTRPTRAACGSGEQLLRDIVVSATRDHVEFARGGPCGFEGEYRATLMRRHVALGREEKATPITGLIALGDEVWLAAGDCGDAAIYRSTDWRTWKRLAVPHVQGKVTLVVDRRSHAVVMATGLCSGTGGGTPAMITRDRGATWTSVSNDTVVEWVAGDDLANLHAGAATGREMRWRAGALVELTAPWKRPPALPAELAIDGRTVRPTAFGLYQGEERVFPR